MEQQDDREPVTEVLVGPDPRLLLVLVVLLVGAALVTVFLLGDGDDGSVALGRLDDLAEQADAGPVRIAELPHLVLMHSTSRTPTYDAHWGENTGSIRLDPRRTLVVLETTDPEDGAELVWCRAARAFAHPDRVRWYAADGRLLAGQGRRGMDRRALSVTGGDQVEVDDSRWVRGPVRASQDTAWTARGDCPELDG